MKRRETIHFLAPVCDVRLTGGGPIPKPEEQIQAQQREDFKRAEAQAREAELARQQAEVFALQNSVLASLQQAVPRVVHECEASLVSLALEVARKLVADLPISTEIVEAAVREALAAVEDTGGVTVLLSPEDLDVLQRASSDVLLSQVSGDRVQFEASPGVTRGGCVVQTRFGVVDAQRETKFAALKHALAA